MESGLLPSTHVLGYFLETLMGLLAGYRHLISYRRLKAARGEALMGDGTPEGVP